MGSICVIKMPWSRADDLSVHASSGWRLQGLTVLLPQSSWQVFCRFRTPCVRAVAHLFAVRGDSPTCLEDSSAMRNSGCDRRASLTRSVCRLWRNRPQCVQCLPTCLTGFSTTSDLAGTITPLLVTTSTPTPICTTSRRRESTFL